MKFKKWMMVLVVSILSGTTLLLAGTTPMMVAFQATLGSKTGTPLEGRREIVISLYDGVQQKWTSGPKQVLFVGGAFSIILGTDPKKLIDEEMFNCTNPRFIVSVTNMNGVASFPIPSTPYAIQSRIAESVMLVDAAKVVGTFPTVDIKSNVYVNANAFVVKAEQGRVGIGTASPQYPLDVVGVINAQGFRINGEDVESALSWKKLGTTIYYNAGKVGIGTATPQYAFEIVGTVNAREYRINGVNLSDQLKAELAWKSGIGKHIYFDDGSLPNAGFIGIGVSDPVEKLDVNGAIRISKAVAQTPQLGTIQYINGDFQGYTSQGWRSLIGVGGSGRNSQIAIWTGDKQLLGAEKLVWKTDVASLGIGTSDPQAHLDIRGDASGRTLLSVRDVKGGSMLYVDDTHVGIGTSLPSQALQVKGIVDAQDFRVNGQPLNKAFSTGSFWYLESNAARPRLFYDLGNVGIGTAEPRNLLELASVSQNAAIGFSIGGTSLFTLGVDAKNQDAFVISKGSDLKTPVFSFNGGKLGIGIGSPSATLQVSGNSGVVFSGQLDSAEPLLETGAGSKLIWYPGKSAFRAGYVLFDQWDQSKLGKYSVGMGYSPLVTGEGATVAGGFKNEATGKYATVPGGLENSAAGDYSFAAGNRAKAKHAGSFVWSDYTVPSTPFESTGPNQFLIRAQNGVGINTTQTQGVALTVSKTGSSSDLIMRMVGNNNNEALAVNVAGGVGIGTTRPGAMKLAVVGGPIGFGTTAQSGFVTIKHNKTTGNIFAVLPYASPTAAILVTASGNVGIGVTTGYQFPPNSVLVVKGGIQGTEFKLVDKNNPQATITLQPNPGSPWADPDKNGGNTFRSNGKVGIGTTTPSNLLTLSNMNPSKNIPVITFDLNNVDLYTLGVTSNSTKTGHLFTINSGGGLVKNPALAISDASVGIGTGLMPPKALLHVSGNVIVSGNLAIGTSNTSSIYRVLVGGAVNTDRLFIGGQEFIEKPNPWKTSGTNIYYTSGNVGIGISNPSQKLEVKGGIVVDTFQTDGPLSLNLEGNLRTNMLKLADQKVNAQNNEGRLYVEDGELKYVNSTDLAHVKVISSPLQRGSGATGNLAFWVDSSSLGETSIQWKKDQKQLLVSGSVVARRINLPQGSVQVTTSISADNAALALEAMLTHDGNLREINGFSAENLLVNINNNWGNITTPIQVKGMDIVIKSKPGTQLLNNAQAIGLFVDVASVNVKETGAKYAAIFKGGNVGIGTLTPKAELEVNGTVSANYFNLTGGLTVPRLDVDKGSLVAMSKLVNNVNRPRIGIGITNPDVLDYELNVRGTVSANRVVVTGGLMTTTLNVHRNTLVVDESGRIGVGTAHPQGQLDIKTEINDVKTGDVISQKIDLSIDAARPGNVFYLNNNIRGLDILFQSFDQSNILAANATGIRINVSSLNVQANSKVTGLDIDVSGTTGKRVAAIFNGGFVGIGTTRPQYALDVVGTLNVTNLRLRGNFESSKAIFDRLVVNQAATFNGTVTVNQLVVLKEITADSLRILSGLSAPVATFSTINATVARFSGDVIAGQLEVQNLLLANKAVFSQGVGIGTTSPASGLRVSGNFSTTSLVVTDALVLESATFNIRDPLVGTSYLVVGGSSGRVGIGTDKPLSKLHLEYGGAQVLPFDPANTDSWNALRIQTKSNVEKVGTGILLIPDDTVPSASVGSGILAVRASSFSGLPSSHLVFVTDPVNGPSKESMRIAHDGNVGIGVVNPTSKLDVNGTMRVSGNLVVLGNLQVPKLVGSGVGLVISANGLVKIDGNVSSNREMVFSKGLYLKRMATPPPALSGYGGLYVSAVDNHLYYQRPGQGFPINVSSAFFGRAMSIPYFGASGSLSDDAPLFWDSNMSKFTIGTANRLTRFEVGVTLNASVVDNLSAQTIYLGFQDRSNVSNSSGRVYTGLSVQFAGINPADPTGFGRLADGETAIGLYVDMTRLSAQQYTSSGKLEKGKKYAALFSGGSVGMGTSSPEAALHVVSNPGMAPFRVDGTGPGLAYALSIPQSGHVGIGVSNPVAKLTVLGETSDASKSAFTILNSALNPIMVVRNDGYVGIGKASPSSELDVNGTVSANVGIFDTMAARKLDIGDGKFVVTSSGNIGIGTALPSDNVNVHLVKKLDSNSQSQGYTAQKFEVTLGETRPNTQFFFDQNITGLDLAIKTVPGSVFGQAGQVVRATGVSINLSDMVLGSSASATGLYVDVSGTTGTRRAAIFLGGSVGIGVIQPQSMLHVNGDVRASKLFLSGGIEVTSATFNTLTVSNRVNFDGGVTVNTLYAKTVSVNAMRIRGVLTVATGSFSTINATSLASFSTLSVGKTSPPVKPYAMEVVGNVYVQGAMTIDDQLTVSRITGLTTKGMSITMDNTLAVKGDVSVTGSVRLNSGLLLTKMASPPVPDARAGILYVDPVGQLNYMYPSGGSGPKGVAKITQSLAGMPKKIPFYGKDGNLSSSANLSWDPDAQTFSVGTANQLVQLNIASTPNTAAVGDIYGQRIQMNFTDRAGNLASTGIFKGMAIQFSGSNPSDPFQFGRLGENETAIGLEVDMTTVRAKQSTTETLPSDQNKTGYKYAALFMGGHVGMGTTQPRASLHVINESLTDSPFRVDAKDTTGAILPYALTVTNRGYVGIGTPSPDAKLTIKAKSSIAGDSVLHVLTSAKKTILFARNDGHIGITTSNVPNAQLTIASDSSIDPFRIYGANNSAFVFDKKGFLGVGTMTPSASLHVVGSGTVPLFQVDSVAKKNVFFVGSDGMVGIGTSSPIYPLSVEGVVFSGSFISQGFSDASVTSIGQDSKGFLVASKGGNSSLFFGINTLSGGSMPTLWSSSTRNMTFQFLSASNQVTNVMSFSPDGRVGISKADMYPSANLHIKSTESTGTIFKIQSVGLNGSLPKDAFVVSAKDGYVGVGTSLPSTNLHVKGALMATSIQVTSGDISISTLNLTGTLKSFLTVNTDTKAVTGQVVAVTVANDMTSDVTGVGITLAADTYTKYGRPYSVYNGATSTGLRVDVTGVGATVLNGYDGSRVAADFIGGYVGIGISNPLAPLHVVARDLGNSTPTDIARFGLTDGSGIFLKGYGNGKMGFSVQDSSQTSAVGLVVQAAGASGRVGIGLTDPSETLHINGDMRLGRVFAATSPQSPVAYGSVLYFSGGPDMSSSYNSDNGVPLWMTRYNSKDMQSELRVGIGKNLSSASQPSRFAVGYTGDGSVGSDFKPVFQVNTTGNVGISNGIDTAFVPLARLHVRGDTVDKSDRLSSHAMIIQTQGQGADALALYNLNGTPGNTTYMSFYYGPSPQNKAGAIVGTDSTVGTSRYGVSYTTSAKDYAEYLQRQVASEVIQKGDLVGVYNGKVSKSTRFAQHIMVKSTAPGVVGNWPGSAKEKDYELIAFFGQVPVAVRGIVHQGDYIVPSGREDGTGVAVSPKAIQMEQIPFIVGTAWEESSAGSQDVAHVLTAVGFAFSTPDLVPHLDQVRQTENALKDLQAQRTKMQTDFQHTYKEQQAEIQAILGRLDALKK